MCTPARCISRSKSSTGLGLGHGYDIAPDLFHLALPALGRFHL
jgi:hypothetical protein